MITLVEARTLQGTLLSLSLEDVDSGIIIEEINGLDPVKATISSSSFATMDGAQFQSSRRETRNITLKFGLEPDYVGETVRDLRSRLYGFFMPKSLITLRFYMDDGLTVDITGRVESFETPFFTNEPVVDISVICFDPDFTGITPVVVNGTRVSSPADILVPYEGTVETGFVFVLSVNRTLGAFTVYNQGPDNTIQTLDFAASLVTGDTLIISTVAGDKRITLTRSGVNTSLLYGMSAQSSWLEFFPGDNQIRVYATGAAVPYTITYTERYGGL